MKYDGDARIDGVPGTAAQCFWSSWILRAQVREPLPTGNVVDRIDGVEVTCIDNGMPVVLLRVSDLGVTGTEAPGPLEANDELKRGLKVFDWSLESA